MKTVKIPEDIQALKFEEAQAEMEALIQRIDNGGMPLEDTTDCFIRCCMLSRHCHNILAEMEKKVLIYTGGKESWTEFDNTGRKRNGTADNKTETSAESDDFSADDENDDIEDSLL